MDEEVVTYYKFVRDSRATVLQFPDTKIKLRGETGMERTKREVKQTWRPGIIPDTSRAKR